MNSCNFPVSLNEDPDWFHLSNDKHDGTNKCIYWLNNFSIPILSR